MYSFLLLLLLTSVLYNAQGDVGGKHLLNATLCSTASSWLCLPAVWCRADSIKWVFEVYLWGETKPKDKRQKISSEMLKGFFVLRLPLWATPILHMIIWFIVNIKIFGKVKILDIHFFPTFSYKILKSYILYTTYVL